MIPFNVYDFIELVKAIIKILIGIIALTILLDEFITNLKKEKLDIISIKKIDTLKRINNFNKLRSKNEIKWYRNNIYIYIISNFYEKNRKILRN